MSSEPSSSPLEDLLKQSTETVANLLRWIVELILNKNWFTLLILIGVTLFFLLKPEGGILLKLLNFEENLPKHYSTSFWLAEGLIFLSAFIVALWTMPRASNVEEKEFAERKAIKGLRPFGFSDSEIFARLQRQRSLRECYESVTNDTFRFGILMGESGCGKTSFIQAGLLPRLAQSEATHLGIYVRFRDQDPILTIQKALVEQLGLQSDQAKDVDFSMLLTQAIEVAAKPLILLFDQFEQFFIHHKRKSEREQFIQALAAWYWSPDLRLVKILVSIRSDLLYYMDEIHKALGYYLGPQEVFALEKFTPGEATKILSIIAETEQIKFDERFISEIAQQELGDREDGLISPVNLQVLAWMIEQQKDELRGFNRNALLKVGGVEGLLARFLDRVLSARMTTKQRQSAIKVLLALTDIEHNVRAGVLTTEDLQNKLGGTLTIEETQETTTWLSRGDVRLVTAIDRDGMVGYELSHERIIQPLRQLAGKTLSQADKANILLDRRVNEWLGNKYSRRYLLGWHELWLIERQKPYLVWGANRLHKEKLLKQSRRQIYGVASGIAAMILLGSIYSGWLFESLLILHMP